MSKRKQTTGAAGEKYEDANRRAAEIILRNPEKYAGLPLKWARLWIKKMEVTNETGKR